MVGFEKEHNKMLNEKMKQLSLSFENDKTQSHFENTRLQEELMHREQTLQLQSN